MKELRAEAAIGTRIIALVRCSPSASGRAVRNYLEKDIVLAATAAFDRSRLAPLHPLRVVLLAGAFPLFLGALLSDWAYSASYQVQWANFASWLIAGALVFSGFALLWSLVDLIRGARSGRRPLLPFLLLLATWVIGFVNALVHARDGWAVMPQGLLLSCLATVLVVAAIWSAFANGRAGGNS